jgi:hypothetical protein
MTTDLLVILSNFALTVVTLLAAFVTLVDIHKDDQKTLRMILFGRHTVKLSRRGGDADDEEA